MTLLEAIEARHSVRRYTDKPISEEALSVLREKIEEVNLLADLHVQLVTDEPKAFSGLMAYGAFSGVRSYLVMAGKKAPDLDERIGYYGEQLVLLAQTLGLNTCWAGASYKKIPGTYDLKDDEKIGCYIALGYGVTQGHGHRVKAAADVSNAGARTLNGSTKVSTRRCSRPPPSISRNSSLNTWGRRAMTSSPKSPPGPPSQ